MGRSQFFFAIFVPFCLAPSIQGFVRFTTVKRTSVLYTQNGSKEKSKKKGTPPPKKRLPERPLAPLGALLDRFQFFFSRSGAPLGGLDTRNCTFYRGETYICENHIMLLPTPSGTPFFPPGEPPRAKKKNETRPKAPYALKTVLGGRNRALVSGAWVPGGEDYR